VKNPSVVHASAILARPLCAWRGRVARANAGKKSMSGMPFSSITVTYRDQEWTGKLPPSPTREARRRRPERKDDNARAVTGGRGRGLRTLCWWRALRGAHEVRVLDRTPPRDGADWPAVDMLDRRAVAPALRGQEAVIHLAAVDRLARAPAETTFDVMSAAPGTSSRCEAAGLRRAVLFSELVVTGVDADHPPLYLPIDEAYPVCPRGTYALTR